MNKSKAIRFSIIILQVATLIMALLCLHTLLTVLSTAISGETFNLEMNMDESTGDFLFNINGNLINKGYLDVKLSFELAILNADGERIETNSTSMNIKAGSTNPFSLNLRIPVEMVQDIYLDGNAGFLEVTFTVRMLGELVGFTNILKVGGGNGI